MIKKIDINNINDAANIYKESWYESHKEICSLPFLNKHTIEYQRRFLINKVKSGWTIFINYENYKAKGIVGLNYKTGEIGLLYVSPLEFRNGYGSKLLEFAIKELKKYKTPFLTVLNINKKARSLYEKYGFYYTGEEKILSVKKGISELNMKI